MIYVIFGVGLLFFAVGFILTENNAKYLLSGYNMMSDEQRQKFDLKGYVPYFRRFHIYLATSFLALGILLHYLIGEGASGIFLTVYPIIAYIYFIATSTKYSKGNNANIYKAGILVLVITGLLVVVLFIYGLKNDELVVHTDSIEIKGMYGLIIDRSEIRSIELSNELPIIKRKRTGFAVGDVAKGYFLTSDDDKVRLVLKSRNGSFILFKLETGEKIYYSAGDDENRILFSAIKSSFPKKIH
jgi:hypothetical protein